MTEDIKQFTKEQIKNLTFGISSLDQKQRELVREKLLRLHDLKSGRISRRTLHLELLKMRQSYQISEIDQHNIEAAFYGA